MNDAELFAPDARYHYGEAAAVSVLSLAKLLQQGSQRRPPMRRESTDLYQRSHWVHRLPAGGKFCAPLSASLPSTLRIFAVLVISWCLGACGDGDESSSEVEDVSDASDGSGDVNETHDAQPADVRDAVASAGDVFVVPEVQADDLWIAADSAESVEPGVRPDRVAPVPVDAPIPPGVQFDELFIPEISEHLIAFAEGDLGFGYSVGGGLLDFDGDMDIDVFLGTNGASTGARACLYENLVDEGELRFRCRYPFDLGRKLTGAWAVDLENDGIDEMVLLGQNWATIERFYPQRARIDLLSLAEVDSECTPATVSVTDHNFDGLADFLLGCRSDNGPGVDRNPRRNHLFVAAADGEYRWIDPTVSESEETLLAGLLVAATNTLAFAQTDVNGDGLLDLHVINDTFSSPESRRTTSNSGGVFLSCRPDETCRYRRVTYGPGLPSWGSFMGLATPWVNNLGFAYFLADWGPNRLLKWSLEQSQFVAKASVHGLEMAGQAKQFRFSWGAIAADFNFDGNDDLFVSQGSMRLGFPSSKGAGEPAFRDQRDVLMVQDNAGNFHGFGSSVGIPIPEFEHGVGIENPRASRGSAFVDFDQDGVGEVFLLPYLGFVRILSERPVVGHRRCTLIPRSRYIPVSGEGYQVRSEPSAEFRIRQLQGHMQLGRPNAILVEGTSGDLRFPSGALVPWVCDDETNSVVVEEPEWVTFNYDEGRLELEISSESWPNITEVSLFVREPMAQVATERQTNWDASSGKFIATEITSDAQFMLSVDGQIVGRWFEVSEPED